MFQKFYHTLFSVYSITAVSQLSISVLFLTVTLETCIHNVHNYFRENLLNS